MSITLIRLSLSLSPLHAVQHLPAHLQGQTCPLPAHLTPLHAVHGVGAIRIFKFKK
jgi:hypothetical protein